MTAQKVLTEKKSTYGAPYGFYTVTLTPSNRTSTGITIKFDISAHLQYADSYTEYGVKCSLYIGGSWHEVTLVSYGTRWQGTTPIKASKTITISGLTNTQTTITGIKFKAIDGYGATYGPSLSETNCSNLTIDYYTAPEQTPATALANTDHISGISYIYFNGAWQ